MLLSTRLLAGQSHVRWQPSAVLFPVRADQRKVQCCSPGADYVHAMIGPRWPLLGFRARLLVRPLALLDWVQLLANGRRTAAVSRTHMRLVLSVVFASVPAWLHSGAARSQMSFQLRDDTLHEPMRLPHCGLSVRTPSSVARSSWTRADWRPCRVADERECICLPTCASGCACICAAAITACSALVRCSGSAERWLLPWCVFSGRRLPICFVPNNFDLRPRT